MIRQVTIQGFKSFGPCVQIQLEPLTFVVGANSSGKTNLLSALRFLKTAVTSTVDQAVADLGGRSEVRNKIQREQKESKLVEISVAVDRLELSFGGSNGNDFCLRSFTYAIKVDLRTDDGQTRIVGEHLLASIRREGGAPATYQMHRTGTKLRMIDPTNPEFAAEREFDVPEQARGRSAINTGFLTVPALLVQEHIQSWLFFSIAPEVARLPASERDRPALGTAGEDLSAVLHEIEARGGPEALQRLADGLRDSVPGFKGVKTVSLPYDAKWGFQVLEERLRSGLNPKSVSDGTVRLLALNVIATWVSERAGLIAIEEPENGLHPWLSEQLVAMFRYASEKCQVIATTHNPGFLDHLSPAEALLCDKQDGFTTIRRASEVAEVEIFRRKFTLGELWQQGALGGVL
jgi:predicted ATPase